MPNMYKYFVYLTDSNEHQFSKRLTVSLDHPIDDSDLEAIEKNNPTSRFSKNVVANYKLIKVTGNFYYHVVYESHPSLTVHFQYSELCILDHKVTVATYQRDIEKFINQISGDDIDILGFQEIPEE